MTLLINNSLLRHGKLSGILELTADLCTDTCNYRLLHGNINSKRIFLNEKDFLGSGVSKIVDNFT